MKAKISKGIGKINDLLEMVNARLLIVLFTAVLFAVLFLWMNESARVEQMHSDQNLLIGRTDCQIVTKWIDIKAGLARSRGQELMLRKGIQNKSEDFNITYLNYAMLDLENLLEKTRADIFAELYLGRDRAIFEAEPFMTADENTIQEISKKGVEIGLLEGISRKKADKIYKLSKYLVLSGLTQETISRVIDNPKSEWGDRAIDELIDIYDVDLYELNNKSCEEILLGKDIESKQQRIIKLLDENKTEAT